MTPIVFMDVDGVLCNFVDGAIRHHGFTDLTHAECPWDFWTPRGFTTADFWADKGESFWAGLEPYPEGLELVERIGRFFDLDRVFLLTHAPNVPGALEGKRLWVERHMSAFSRRLFTGENKWALTGTSKILIDDSDQNGVAFTGEGGPTVMPPRPWNTLASACLPGGHFDPVKVADAVKWAVGAVRHRG